jgi:hypothetical protein
MLRKSARLTRIRNNPSQRRTARLRLEFACRAGSTRSGTLWLDSLPQIETHPPLTLVRVVLYRINSNRRNQRCVKGILNEGERTVLDVMIKDDRLFGATSAWGFETFDSKNGRLAETIARDAMPVTHRRRIAIWFSPPSQVPLTQARPTQRVISSGRLGAAFLGGPRWGSQNSEGAMAMSEAEAPPSAGRGKKTKAVPKTEGRTGDAR